MLDGTVSDGAASTAGEALSPPALGLDEVIRRVRPLAVLGSARTVVVSGITHHHEEVRPGYLFCCLPGERVDGHVYAPVAAERGAVAFICEHSLSGVGGAQLVVGPGMARPAMAEAACAVWRDPASAMRTVGVTGTNGKTTVTFLLRTIFERHGWRAGVIGTLDGVRTTPEAPELQRSLAAQRDAGCRATALEVTSHALSQRRVDGICFDVAVFTNLTQDHLDYHKTMEAYFAAKAELFTPERCRAAAVNASDEFGQRLVERAAVPTVAFSIADAGPLEVGLERSSFTLFGRRAEISLGGSFNVENALAAAHAARLLGIGDDTIVEALAAAPRVPGRLEPVPAAGGLTVLVDYAHTPAGLAQVLAAARGGARGGDARVIVVFGCGGDRDRGKRPAMGRVASELADVVVVTSDNPRSEEPLAIIEQVSAGVVAGSDCEVEPDRRSAIGLALRRARSGDVVVVAGKGHEATQQTAAGVEPFDDREVVRQELARLGLGVRSAAAGAKARRP